MSIGKKEINPPPLVVPDFEQITLYFDSKIALENSFRVSERETEREPEQISVIVSKEGSENQRSRAPPEEELKITS